MTGEQIIEQWAAHPDHPVTISTAERASVVELVSGLRATQNFPRWLRESNIKLRIELEDARLEYAKNYNEIAIQWQDAHAIYEEQEAEVKRLQEEIAALTPDAQAWRDRQARFESEKQEMQGRINKCRNQ
jgi:predicted  nucleic acid-binding Zn-ribbon protein